MASSLLRSHLGALYQIAPVAAVKILVVAFNQHDFERRVQPCAGPGVDPISPDRRIATRYDKTRRSLLAFLNLAAARLWLKNYVNRT